MIQSKQRDIHAMPFRGNFDYKIVEYLDIRSFTAISPKRNEITCALHGTTFGNKE